MLPLRHADVHERHKGDGDGWTCGINGIFRSRGWKKISFFAFGLLIGPCDEWYMTYLCHGFQQLSLHCLLCRECFYTVVSGSNCSPCTRWGRRRAAGTPSTATR